MKNVTELVKAAVVTTAMIGLSLPAVAGAKKDAPQTPATEFHGLPGNNPAYGGNSANPNGTGNGTAGGGIHAIRNVPGKNDASNNDGVPGFANELNQVHGGIGAANKNVGKELP